MGELPLVYVGMLAVEVAGDGVLQEGVPNGLQSFQVNGIVGIGHGQRLNEQNLSISRCIQALANGNKQKAAMKGKHRRYCENRHKPFGFLKAKALITEPLKGLREMAPAHIGTCSRSEGEGPGWVSSSG